MFFVSGKKQDKKATNTHAIPNINIGNGFQISDNLATKGAANPKTLATVEHVPTA